MASPSPTLAAHRGRVAALSRSREADDPDLVRAREALQTTKFVEHIERIVAAAPPLPAAERERLATLLRGGGAHDAA